ncbi:hypothetical protein V6N13_113432 [Hibiscus sabdariffa]
MYKKNTSWLYVLVGKVGKKNSFNMRGSPTTRSDFNFFIISCFFINVGVAAQPRNTVPVNVGVVLDMDSLVGKIGMSCIDAALSDFYAANPHYETRLVLHAKDSMGDVVAAATAGSSSLLRSFIYTYILLHPLFTCTYSDLNLEVH